MPRNSADKTLTQLRHCALTVTTRVWPDLFSCQVDRGNQYLDPVRLDLTIHACTVDPLRVFALIGMVLFWPLYRTGSISPSARKFC